MAKENKQLSYRIGSFLDDIVGIFSPMEATRRRNWRNYYIGYDAATPTRKDEPFPWDGKAEAMNKAARQTVRARARDLERNSEVVEGFLKAFDRNVVGSGVTMQAQTRSTAFNDRIEELWNEWCHAENCDIAETQSLDEILSMVLRRMRIDGGVMVIYSLDKTKLIPLQLQVREVDDLATGSYPVSKSKDIIFSEGIERTKQGKPIAYYLTSTDADGMETAIPERIPAERVSFIWNKERPSQFREISPMAKSVPRIKDLDDYNQAVAFQQKTQACTSVYVESDNMAIQPGRPANVGKYDRIEQISAGSVNYLNPGERAKTLIPSGQAAEVEGYMVTQLRITSAAQGLSLESSTRNVERVNYSSARQNLIEDDKEYKKVRKKLLEHLLRPMYKKFVEICYLAGQLDNCGFDPTDKSFYTTTWLCEGMPWIDPKKETEADAIALSNNTTTLQEICSRSGKDWLEVLDQRKREQDEITKRGLNLSLVIGNKETEEKGEGEDEEGKGKDRKGQSKQN